MTNTELADRLEALDKAATLGDLATAEFSRDEVIECPLCDGSGEVDAKDYCNFDHKALGVQFYGIGDEHVAHERLWSALRNNLTAILTALREADRLAKENAGLREGLKPFSDAWVANEYLAEAHWSAFRDARALLEGEGS